MMRRVPLRQAGIAAATFGLLAGLSFTLITLSLRAQPVRVNVRWTPGTTDVDRRAIEQRFSLIGGEHIDGATWRYLLANRSSRNIEALVKEPRVEDTNNIDRAAFRLVEVPAPLTSDVLFALAAAAAGAAAFATLRHHLTIWRFLVMLLAGYAVIAASPTLITRLPVALAVPMAGALLAGIKGSSARQLVLEPRRAALPLLSWVKSVLVPCGERLEEWVSHGYRWATVLALAWAALLLPVIAVGPWDIEEYYTGVVATKVAMDALLQGSWPFWNPDFGLGVSQPLKFHFIFHPLAPLCEVTDCGAVLRSIAGLHILAGALCMGLLTLRLVGNRLLAMAAGVTYCLSSSVVQTMLVDDWPITALNESALPVLLYAVVAIGDAKDRRGILLWTLILGGAAGLIASTSFPLVMLVILAVVAVATPAVRRRFPWLVAAAVITLLIGGSQIHNIFEQVQSTPPAIVRRDHPEPELTMLAWSTFLRPLSLSEFSSSWRTVFVGPPFAVAAIVAFLSRPAPGTRPLRVGLALGLLGYLVPPAWLFNVNTAQWSYRAELNVFGILLGAYGIHCWTRDAGKRRWLGALVALQLTWMAAAVAPTWAPVLARAVGLTGSPRFVVPPATVTDQIAALHAAQPGRVVLAPHAQRELESRSLAGLVPNQLQMAGIPALSAILYGVATDELYPADYMLESQLKVDAASFRNKALLDVLGARYVVAVASDVIPSGLREIRHLDHQLRVYENPDAWPEAFFVDALPSAPVPRLTDCRHDRFLCADFARYDLGRQPEPLHMVRLGDGVSLTFPPSDATRYIVLTHWYRPGWIVSQGRASVTRVAEQFVGLRVEPLETRIELRYRPRVRAALFVSSLASEIVVGVAVLCLAYASWRRPLSPKVEDNRAREGVSV